jgi:hypothetical protein
MINVFQAPMMRSPSDVDYARLIVDFAEVHIHNRPLFFFSETPKSFP